ncbi:MAG TPA: AmmeMemoRadiSam system radical SAM enzyme [Methanosarcinales archaeon]|nr:AmmeMemoRadiSam system radical SAM enzyme [Methanosarcinales archaeon]
MIHEASLFEKLENRKVKCHVCAHECTIADGKRGICGVRENRGGTLCTLIYNTVSSEAVDPIEKKPLYHFLPGTLSYSQGTIGCNFRCAHCQNWTISQVKPEQAHIREITPEESVARALASDCASISWTYNEPTIWHEFTYDSARLAHEAGLKTVYVTNGYITEDALRDISPYLDAFRVDIKAFRDEFYRDTCRARLQPVLDSSVVARELGMHIEVVNLIIPGKNDDPKETRDLIEWVHDNLGPQTPVHFTRFYPMYKMKDASPTPVATLERAWQMAKDAGMEYPYVGNVAGHDYENTYCPGCGALLVNRSGFQIARNVITEDKKCPDCGHGIAVVLD